MKQYLINHNAWPILMEVRHLCMISLSKHQLKKWNTLQTPVVIQNNFIRILHLLPLPILPQEGCLDALFKAVTEVLWSNSTAKTGNKCNHCNVLVSSQHSQTVTASQERPDVWDTYIVAIAISLSERLSLDDLGAAGNSISNFDSFDMVPPC